MKSFTIIFDNEVSLNDIKNYAIARGGVLIAEWDRVTVSIGGSSIYIDFYEGVADFDEQEIDGIYKLLKKKPSKFISVHVGHSDGSDLLAKNFARSVHQEFNCVVWDDESNFDGNDYSDLKIIVD